MNQNMAKEVLQKLSVVIPARDEERSIASTVEHLRAALVKETIPHEIVVVDDGSTDSTWTRIETLCHSVPTLRPIQNPGPHGFGCAVRYGLDHISGDAVVIMMGDESDDCGDVVAYWNTLQQGYDCVFGSRFIKGGRTVNYPLFKWLLNRVANAFISSLFRIKLNDTTNAFKAYRLRVIQGCTPLLSMHFNLTVELPLKAICRGFSWTVIPVSWRNRRSGIAKLKIQEMGSRYLYVILYVWLEKILGRRVYERKR